MISVITPTYERPALLLERAWPSVHSQTHTDWEWIVVGDGAGRETVAAMATIHDQRVRFVNAPRFPFYPADPEAFWQVAGSGPAAIGVSLARGDWLTFLGDDDELTPGSLTALLDASTDADCIYSRAEVVGHGWLGSWPPREGHIVQVMWRRALGFTVDPESWTRNLPCDWDLWSRMLAAGTHWAFTPTVTYRYHPSRNVPEGVEPFSWGGGSPKETRTPNYPRPLRSDCVRVTTTPGGPD